MTAKKKSFQATTFIMVTLLMGFMAACGTKSGAEDRPAAAKEKVTVNIGVQGKTGILPYAREKGFFEKAFSAAGAEVKWNEFASGPRTSKRWPPAGSISAPLAERRLFPARSAVSISKPLP
ncbi:hypothetical protein LJK88_35540 [Paenibacillus sp. P26]|nr:hypothetical protein LJK88_35540 [Paenibacillus sp. P26]